MVIYADINTITRELTQKNTNYRFNPRVSSVGVVRHRYERVECYNA